MPIKLQSIFISHPGKQRYTKQEALALGLQVDFLQEMTVRLDLGFENISPPESSVCFANSMDVRPELRTTFTENDMVTYVSAFLTKDCYELDTFEIPFPANSLEFWEGVEKGG